MQQHGPEAGLHERATGAEICAYYDRVLRDRFVGVGPGRVPPEQRLRRRPSVRLARLGRRGSRCRAAAGSSTPATSRPTIPADHPAAVRGRGRRARGAGQRPRRLDGGARRVRRRGLGQDRDRRVHLAARQRGGPRTRSAGCGPATPGCSTARSSSRTRRSSSGMAADIMEAAAAARLAGRPVPPPGGRRGDAAHRPVGDSDDGEDAHAGHLGARPAAHASSTSSGSGTSGAWSPGR